MTDLKQGYVPNEVYKVEQFGNSFKLIDTQGVKVGTMGTTTTNRKNTFKQGKTLRLILPKMVKRYTKKLIWMCIITLVIPMNTQDGGVQFEDKGDHINH